MKKTTCLLSLVSCFLIAGCSFDYYRGGVRMVQDDDDCIVYARESGRHFNREIKSMRRDEKIVYRNKKCRAMFERDAVPVVVDAPKSCVKKSCACNIGCANTPKITRRWYVIK